MSQREVFLRDIRKFSDPLIIEKFDQSHGILIPIYDWKTDMLIMGKKGENTIFHLGISGNQFVTHCKCTGRYPTDIIYKQIKSILFFHNIRLIISLHSSSNQRYLFRSSRNVESK